MRPSLAVVVLIFPIFGCQKAESKHHEEPSASSAIAPVASIVPAPSASIAAPVTPSGPCAGKAIDATDCDGDKVVRCKGPGQTPEIVQTCFSIEKCAAGACVGACPEGEIYIPPTDAKGFTMGKGAEPFAFGSRASGNKGHGVADAPHKVILTKPFCMDQTEVTAGAYKKCVEEKGCKVPVKPDVWATFKDKPDYPINMVDWAMGKYYCEQMEKSLPTEAQWEWAATGGDGRKWPWGDELPSCEFADYTQGVLISPGGNSGCHGGGPSKVGTHPKGDRVLPWGVIHDLAGNVWEWCLDSYEPYRGIPETDPIHDNANIGNRVVRGGGWNRSSKGIMSAYRGGAIVTYKVPGLGFRCVRNPR